MSTHVKQYTVTRNLFGILNVKYACPHCSVKLSDPLVSAGQDGTCPDCSESFVIPGSAEKEAELRSTMVQDEKKKRLVKRTQEEKKLQIAESKAKKETSKEETQTQSTMIGKALETTLGCGGCLVVLLSPWILFASVAGIAYLLGADEETTNAVGITAMFIFFVIPAFLLLMYGVLWLCTDGSNRIPVRKGGPSITVPIDLDKDGDNDIYIHM